MSEQDWYTFLSTWGWWIIGLAVACTARWIWDRSSPIARVGGFAVSVIAWPLAVLASVVRWGLRLAGRH